MKNVMMKSKSLLVSLGIILVLCSFSADYAGFLDTHYSVIVEGTYRNGKDIVFTGHNTVDVTIQNYYTTGAKVTLECISLGFSPEDFILLPRERYGRVFHAETQELPVLWHFSLLAGTALDDHERFAVNFVAEWRPFDLDY